MSLEALLKVLLIRASFYLKKLDFLGNTKSVLYFEKGPVKLGAHAPNLGAHAHKLGVYGTA